MQRDFKFPPPTPPNEDHRLRELDSLDLLERSDDGKFDRLTQLSSLVTEAPKAWFGVIDDQCQLMHSVYGARRETIPRHDTLCAYTMLGNDPLVIEDIDDHYFFGTHSQFEELRHRIGSYMGVPVHGVFFRGTLGTLAVADEAPHRFDERHRRGLQMLRDELENQLKLRLLHRQLDEHRRRLQRLIDERKEMFRNIRSRAIDVAGVLQSDAGFIERLSDKQEIAEAARDIAASGESIEDILEMSEGYVMWSTGQLKMLSSKMAEFSE